MNVADERERRRPDRVFSLCTTRAHSCSRNIFEVTKLAVALESRAPSGAPAPPHSTRCAGRCSTSARRDYVAVCCGMPVRWVPSRALADATYGGEATRNCESDYGDRFRRGRLAAAFAAPESVAGAGVRRRRVLAAVVRRRLADGGGGSIPTVVGSPMAASPELRVDAALTRPLRARGWRGRLFTGGAGGGLSRDTASGSGAGGTCVAGGAPLSPMAGAAAVRARSPRRRPPLRPRRGRLRPELSAEGDDPPNAAETARAALA